MLVVYLRPRHRFPPRLGSHTLFGAICSALGELEGPSAVAALLERFKDGGEAPFLVSSAFPYLFGESLAPQRFWPLPLGAAQAPARRPDEWFRAAKDLKGRGYLHESLLVKWAHGDLDEERLLEAWGADPEAFGPREESQGLLWPRGALPPKLDFTMTEGELPHNVLDRLTTASVNFYHTLTGFYRGAGLWFALEAPGESLKLVREALQWLADTRGFGPDISTGAGQFSLAEGSFEPLEADWLKPNGGQEARALALSGVCPESAPSANSFYELLELRGYSARGRWEKRVRLLAPGATFPWAERPRGRLVEVKGQQGPEGHPIYLYGLGLYIKLQEGV